MKKVLLTILDGIGLREETKGNALKQANMPNFNYLLNNYPSSTLIASSEEVGLPFGQMGNSEVGHLNIGSGRIVYQPSQFINKQIKNKEFFKNEEIIKILNYVKSNNKNLHIVGLVSDGGVHSSMLHLHALIDMIKEQGIDNFYIHAITDGRDTLRTSGLGYLKELDDHLKEIKAGSIATIMGRFYAMDRDNRWDRVEIAYNGLIKGIGTKFNTFEEAINSSYQEEITDEFIKPAILDEKGLINDGDAIIDFNFRPDRLRELLSAFTNSEFNEFKQEFIIDNLLTFMPVPKEVICTNAYKNQTIDMPLGEYIDSNDLNQLRIAETEKYAHVTYFFDGGVERDLKNCERILVPSPKVTTYDEAPKMSAKEITDKLLIELDKEKHDLVVLNYANGDMLGHTGKMKETIESLEFLDECLGKLYNKAKEKDYIMVIIADHGNCEQLLDEDNNVITSHTTNEVPIIVTTKNIKIKSGKLSDVAPTILNLMELKKPIEMTGENLIDIN